MLAQGPVIDSYVFFKRQKDVKLIHLLALLESGVRFVMEGEMQFESCQEE
jgi:hypothetical protein